MTKQQYINRIAELLYMRHLAVYAPARAEITTKLNTVRKSAAAAFGVTKADVEPFYQDLLNLHR